MAVYCANHKIDRNRLASCEDLQPLHQLSSAIQTRIKVDNSCVLGVHHTTPNWDFFARRVDPEENELHSSEGGMCRERSR